MLRMPTDPLDGPARWSRSYGFRSGFPISVPCFCTISYKVVVLMLLPGFLFRPRLRSTKLSGSIRIKLARGLLVQQEELGGIYLHVYIFTYVGTIARLGPIWYFVYVMLCLKLESKVHRKGLCLKLHHHWDC